MSGIPLLRRTRGRVVAAVTAATMIAAFPLLRPSGAAELVLTTVVNADNRDALGDGGPAVEAGVDEPRMISFDGKGGYYIADTYNHVIRYVDPAGIISTVAGRPNQPGYGGDGGPGTQALLEAPHSVDVDRDGNVLIGDPVNDRIRKLDTATGIITTVAGGGTPSSGNGDGGPATAARLNDSKIGIGAPDGSIYIADFGHKRVRKVLPNGMITTYAGNGQAGSLGPSADDGGPATEAALAPRSILLDHDGNLLIADRDAQKIRRVDAATGIITTIAGRGAVGDGGDGGPALEAEFNEPRGLGIDWDGNIYVADSKNNKVRRFRPGGRIETVVGTGESGRVDGAIPDEAKLSNPRSVEFNDAGDMYISDSGSHRIRMVAGMASPRPVSTTTTTAPPTGGDPGPTPPTTSPGPARPPVNQPGEVRGAGYWMLGSDGAVYAFGDAAHHGNAPSPTGAVDIEPVPAGDGYWVVDAAGRVHASGDAAHHGDVPTSVLAAGERVTSLSATRSGNGYWVFTDRGRVLTFGDAVWHGDMAAHVLNGPVLDSIPTPSGKGYYMVASDGGIFSFGDAAFWGSMGGTPLNAPVQSLVPDPDGRGYWLVASDGGIFAFEAPFRGSMGDTALNRPVSGMVAYGDGYLMVGEDGGIFNFSSQPFLGSLGDQPPAHPIVAVASLA